MLWEPWDEAEEEAPEAPETLPEPDGEADAELRELLLARRWRGSLGIGLKFSSTGTYLGLPVPRAEDGFAEEEPEAG